MIVDANIRPERRLLQFLETYGLVIVLVGLFLVFFALRPPIGSASNFVTILKAASISVIMVIGLTWIIATGQIDVSFVASAALANMISAWLVQNGFGWGAGIACGLSAGVVIGLVNGLLIQYLGLAPLVVTIATGGLGSSIAAAIGLGTSFRIDDTGFLGTFMETHFGIFPAVTIVAIVVVGFAWFVQEKLTIGHYIYAQESNFEAVHEAGINVRRLNMMLFVFSSVMASIAGILLAAGLSSGQPQIGTSYFIDGLTAVFLGSIAIRTGQSNVLGTLVGILILAVLSSGAALMGWPDYQREIIKGAMLLVGIWLVVVSRPQTRDAAQEM